MPVSDLRYANAKITHTDGIVAVQGECKAGLAKSTILRCDASLTHRLNGATMADDNGWEPRMITLYAFRWVPDFAQGHVRDLRVRWALEEAGLLYEQKLISFAEKMNPEYLALQPFGQVPAIEEDGCKQFESGAIVLNIARRSPRSANSYPPTPTAPRCPTRCSASRPRNSRWATAPHRAGHSRT